VNPRDQSSTALANGSRQMLPPSPQSYHPRFAQQPTPNMSMNHSQNGNRDLPPPQHRPSTSMSISSMLGSDTDPLSRDHNPASVSRPASSYPSMGSYQPPAMSPPQHPTKPGPGDYSYKPRSQTPDRIGIPNLLGTRQYRSGSGSIMQGSRPFENPVRAPSRSVFTNFGEPPQPPRSQEPGRRTEEPQNNVRRTSIPGILQRPSSQPQPQPPPPPNDTFVGPRLHSFTHPSPHRPIWPEHSRPQTSMSANTSPPNVLGVRDMQGPGNVPQNGQPVQSSAPLTQYDLRPPGFISSVQQQPTTAQDREAQPRVSPWERPPSHSTSPDIRRQMIGPSHFRPFGSILNGQNSVGNQQPVQEPHQPGSVPMGKQDSTQSQSERSIFGERLDKSRSKLFSPFAGSHTSQNFPSASAPPEEQSRKGSDELSQHRALLGLAAEGKRGGRYSPLPQAVQGAQAQSIGPEVGIKTEHGRIFSGLGSGVGTATASPAHGPAGLAVSPFKRDDNGGPRMLSEDNLMRMSRSTSGFGKRARNIKEEDGKAASENDGNGRPGKKSRNHQ
jgi:hypothetical protein